MFKEKGCKAIRQTAKAVLIRRPDGSQTWVPQSAIHEDSEVFENGHEGELVVLDWFSENEGWT